LYQLLSVYVGFLQINTKKISKGSYSILALLISFFTCLSVIAQDTEFWFCPPSAYISRAYYAGGNGGFVFTNTTPRTATVQIEYLKTGTTESVIIPPNEGYHLKKTKGFINTNIVSQYKATHTPYPTTPSHIANTVTPGNIAGIVQQGGVKITSDEPIMCYYFYDDDANKEIFVLKGKNALGQSFYIPQSSDGSYLNGRNPGIPGSAAHYQVNARDMIVIQATESGNTQVQFNIPRTCWRGGEGSSTTFAANMGTTPHTVTLSQGEIFVLMETERGTFGSFNTLGGAYISSDKNIVVTSMEDYTNVDACGDQLMPISRTGTLYPIVKGYSASPFQDVVYIYATQPNTTIHYTRSDGTPESSTLITTAGGAAVYNMGGQFVQPYELLIESDKPCYVLHFTANNTHPAASLIPSLYSVAQNKFNFYQLGRGTNVVDNKMMLVYRENCDTSFVINFPGIPGGLSLPLLTAPNTINPVLAGIGMTLDTPDTPIPGLPGTVGWNFMRIGLSDDSNNDVVHLSNTNSVFSLGYYSGSNTGTDPLFQYYNTYGYLSGYGDWSFEIDTFWRCADERYRPITLMGGYAKSYLWTLPDNSTLTTPTIKARDEGMYILEMNQDYRVIKDTVWIYNLIFNAKINKNPAMPKYAKINVPQNFNAEMSGSLRNVATYNWTFEGGTPATSTSANPSVTWNAIGQKQITLQLRVEKQVGSDIIACDTTLRLNIQVIDKLNGFFVKENTIGGKNDGSNWDNAFRTIQEALAVASQGDYIWIAEGNYSPPSGQSFVMNYDSVMIYGGFGGWESDLSERIFSKHPTILKGSGSSVIRIDGGTTYSNGLCGTSRAAGWDGFIIQEGKAQKGVYGSSGNGGGILFTNGATATISNCIIKNNTAEEYGGGIYLEAPTTCTTDTSLFYNNEISGNIAAQGGGIYNAGSHTKFLHVTIGGNKATSTGGLVNQSGEPCFLNSIIWGNLTTSTNSPKDVSILSGTPYYEFSTIGNSNGSGEKWNNELGIDGGKNIDINPLYRTKGYDQKGEMQVGDYRLSSASKSANSGKNLYVYAGNHILQSINLQDPVNRIYRKDIPNDLAGEERVISDIVDRGAYEHDPDANIRPDIKHRVLINEYTGIQSDPITGEHFVTGHTDFVVTFIPEPGYSLKDVTVTTGSIWLDERGGTELYHNEDGSLTILFHRITEHFEIKLHNIGTVSNEFLNKDMTIWATKGVLHIQSNKNGILQIHTLNGQLYKQQSIKEGKLNIALPQGIYIISLDNDTQQKILIE